MCCWAAVSQSAGPGTPAQPRSPCGVSWSLSRAACGVWAVCGGVQRVVERVLERAPGGRADATPPVRIWANTDCPLHPLASFSPRALTSPRRDHPQMLSTSPRPVLRRPCPPSDARLNHGHLAIVFPRRRCARAPAKTRRVPVLISLCARCFERSAPLNSLLTSYLSNQHSNVRTQLRTGDIYTPSQVALRVYASWPLETASSVGAVCLHAVYGTRGSHLQYFHGHPNDRPVTRRTPLPPAQTVWTEA